MPRRSPDGPLPEAFEGLDEWAGHVAAAVSAGELGGLIAGYRKTAANRRISADNRRLATMQADALEAARPRRKRKPAKSKAG